MRRALTKTLMSMERDVLRTASRTQVLRGISDLQKYCDKLGQTAHDVSHIVHGLPQLVEKGDSARFGTCLGNELERHF